MCRAVTSSLHLDLHTPHADVMRAIKGESGRLMQPPDILSPTFVVVVEYVPVSKFVFVTLNSFSRPEVFFIRFLCVILIARSLLNQNLFLNLLSDFCFILNCIKRRMSCFSI